MNNGTDGSRESSSALPPTRGYQQEMLEESLGGNIIVALDTGSGKTHIAILRLKHQCEYETKKVSWFLAPTVALCEQQRTVINVGLHVSVGLISGALEPDQWKDRCLWKRILKSHRVIVSTPQPLLDALRHGYIDMGSDISLLVFDEAHHAVDNHPYNQIMKEFYFALPSSDPSLENERTRPMVLGLTASPIFSGDVLKAFRTIETNLDSSIRTPRIHADELASYVHRPVFKHVSYASSDPFNPPFSSSLSSLESVIDSLDIEDDPYVQRLRSQLQRATPGPERTRIDQKLSKAISKGKTYTHSGLNDFCMAAQEICGDIGPWAADWYVAKVLEHAKSTARVLPAFFRTLEVKEKAYLLSLLDRIQVTQVSYEPQDIVAGSSDKVRALVESLEATKADTESYNEPYSGLVFVTRRDAVFALAEVLIHHPRTAHLFKVGCLVGSSESRFRQTFLDITRQLAKQPQEDTLDEFRMGDKNLIISTSVAEEGIDIQSCCNVIRWDPPPNMVSWLQSRGRARRHRSIFTVMLPDGENHDLYMSKWEEIERKMVNLYNDARRERARAIAEAIMLSDEDEEDGLSLRVESTGAYITPHSAVSHLSHFCAVIPSSSNAAYTPIYEIEPPDYPEGWHSYLRRSDHYSSPYLGPWGSTVTLPRCIDSSLRVFSTDMTFKSKISAHRHAAFMAYCGLYEAELLNEHLLPGPDDEVKALKKEVEKRVGTAEVQRQMDPWSSPAGSDVWWSSELAIGGLPNLRMFTRSRPVNLADNESPVLNIPNGSPVAVRWLTKDASRVSSDVIDKAREYTREMFWCMYGNRMKWEDLGFPYLFLPTDTVDQPLWAARRAWLAESCGETTKINNPLLFIANAASFGKRFSFPDDLSLIRKQFGWGKAYRFSRWEFKTISDEEEEKLRKDNELSPDMELTYPLLVVQVLPGRSHLLLPDTKTVQPPQEIFLSSRSTVSLFSKTDTEYCLILPSIIRFLSMATTAQSLRETLFSNSPLSTIPLSLVTHAITASASQELVNYQRLETLGDTVLKFIVSLQLLAEYRYWHEGYLAMKKDHTVSNVRLAKDALSKELYQWIIRDFFAPKKWRPAYRSRIVDHPEPSSEDVVGDGDGTKRVPKKKEDLSTKMLADVVEALIGAAYLHGSFDMSVECAQLFGLGIDSWQSVGQRVEMILSRTEIYDDEFPTQISDVERMIGYEFKRKLFLIEALTHSSYEGSSLTVSYERMEFLGDSVLDMVVTDVLYHAPGRKYSPGHMHMRRSAVVNAHFLAFICLQCFVGKGAVMPKPADHHGEVVIAEDEEPAYLWQCLFHSSHYILEAQRRSFTRYRKVRGEIEEALKRGDCFPWAALTSLQAPKFFSDMVESVIGAVYLDSRGDWEVVRGVVRALGILEVLERVVKENVDVLHPISRMSMWADRHGMDVEYVIEKERGRVACSILVDEREQVRVEEEHNGRASEEQVKLWAAEKAIWEFGLRDDKSASLKRRRTKPKKKKKKKSV